MSNLNYWTIVGVWTVIAIYVIQSRFQGSNQRLGDSVCREDQTVVWHHQDNSNTTSGASFGVMYASVWDSAYANGMFRVGLETYAEKYVRSKEGTFLLSHNPGRKSKRKGMPLAPPRVDEPFNISKFHFGKVAPNEILMYFVHNTDDGDGGDKNDVAIKNIYNNNNDDNHYNDNNNNNNNNNHNNNDNNNNNNIINNNNDNNKNNNHHNNNGNMMSCVNTHDTTPSSFQHHPNLVAHPIMINPFPLGHRSGLFVPFLRQYRNQVMHVDALELGLRLAHDLQWEGVKVGYNSLGAGASVNHFHFQTWQPHNTLPVELSDVEEFSVRASWLTTDVWAAISPPNVPITFLRWNLQFPLGPTTTTTATTTTTTMMTAVATSIQHCVDVLVKAAIPHNLVLTGKHAFLFPRRHVVLLDSINTGFPEVAGNVICPDDALYNTITAETIAEHMHANIRLDPTTFAKLHVACLPRK